MEVLTYNPNDRLQPIMDDATAAAVLLSVSPDMHGNQPISVPYRCDINNDPLVSLASIATMNEEEGEDIQKQRSLSLTSLSSSRSLNDSSSYTENSFTEKEPATYRSTSMPMYETPNSLLYIPHPLREAYNKNGRIGVYTQEQRKKIIERYLSKREHRVWRKRIRYGCRKELADQRQRFKGRFVKLPKETEAGHISN